jgi:opacity protein-like surface antigen
MTRHRSLAIAALLALATAAPLSAQVLDWQNQWYWGAKGGLLNYTLPSGKSNQVQVGGEWLITAHRTALYVGYSSTLKRDGDTFTTSTGTTVPVVFDAFQRIQLAVLVFPWNGNIQPYGGIGLAIETLSNAQVNSTTPTSVQNQFVSDHSSGGFALAMAGLQLRVAKLAVFGQAQFSPQGRDFMLSGSSISLEVGVRYAFLGSRETGEGGATRK